MHIQQSLCTSYKRAQKLMLIFMEQDYAMFGGFEKAQRASSEEQLSLGASVNLCLSRMTINMPHGMTN